jgi:hypothetical protein
MQAHGVRTALALAAVSQLAGTVLLMRGSRYVQAALRRAAPAMVTG